MSSKLRRLNIAELLELWSRLDYDTILAFFGKREGIIKLSPEQDIYCLPVIYYK